jgi:hypothetical protein
MKILGNNQINLQDFLVPCFDFPGKHQNKLSQDSLEAGNMPIDVRNFALFSGSFEVAREYLHNYFQPQPSR